MPARHSRQSTKTKSLPWWLLLAPLLLLLWIVAVKPPELVLVAIGDDIWIRSTTQEQDNLWTIPKASLPVVIGSEIRLAAFDATDSAVVSEVIQTLIGVSPDIICTDNCPSLDASRSKLATTWPQLSLTQKMSLARHSSFAPELIKKTISDLGQSTDNGYTLDRFSRWHPSAKRAILDGRPLTMTIINAAQISGLASRYAAIARLHGFDVVAIKDGQSKQPTSSLWVDTSISDLEFVTHAIEPLPLSLEPTYQAGIMEQHRSQLVLEVGADGEAAFDAVLTRPTRPQTRLLHQ